MKQQYHRNKQYHMNVTNVHKPEYSAKYARQSIVLPLRLIRTVYKYKYNYDLDEM